MQADTASGIGSVQADTASAVGQAAGAAVTAQDVGAASVTTCPPGPTYPTGFGGNVCVPGGDAAFADSVVSFTPGDYAAGCQPNDDPSAAVGPADAGTGSNGADVSLGGDGRIVLHFSTPLTGSGSSASDVFVWETGPAAEGYRVDVSPNGSDWTTVGQSDESTQGSQGFDIDDNGFGLSARLYYVRIIDIGDLVSGCSDDTPVSRAGSDIDAVAVLSNITPDISLDKTASPSSDLKPGDVVTYSFAVDNTGTDTLNNIDVTDPMDGLSAISCPSTTLAPGNSFTCTATYTITQADADSGEPISNTADVSGVPASGGDPVSDEDTATATVSQTAAISIDKIADYTTELTVGEVINYRFVVTNTGAVTLTDVNVTDPLPGLSDISPASIATLPAGGTATFTAQYTITQADVDAGTLSNTATTTGTPPETCVDCTPPTGTDTEVTPGDPEPSLGLVKSSDVTGSTTVHAGDTVTYTYLLTNTGNVTIDDANVTDPMPGLRAVSPASVDVLNPGDSASFTATYVVTQADIDAGSLSNTGTGHGTPPASCDACGPVNEPTDDLVVPLAQDPELTLLKTAAPESGVVAGDTITYTYVATNAGNVTIADATIADAHAGLTWVTGPDLGTIAPGATATGTATYVVTQADVNSGVVHNSATVSGTPPATCEDCTPPTSLPSIADVPTDSTTALTLDKTADTAGPVAVGDTITYTFTATNTGTVPLSDVTVMDDHAGLAWVTGPDLGTLDPGAIATGTATYVVTELDVAAGTIDNSATATGTPPAECTSCDPPTTPPSVVHVPTDSPAPAVDLTKTADTAGPVGVGDTITYTFSAENTGNLTLTDVTVTDALAGLTWVTGPDLGTLAPGVTATGTATYVVTELDVANGAIDNSATATGTPPGEVPPPVSPLSEVHVPTDPATPGLDLTKTADTAGPVKVGDTITYTFTAENTGNQTLTDVTVSDELAGLTWVAGPDLGTIAPGETATGTATYVVTQADVDAGGVDNSATATGTPPADCTVCDPPIAPPTAVHVPSDAGAPGLTVTKTADTAGPVAVGDTITYTFAAENTGNVTLSDVTVTDAHAGLTWVTGPDLGTLAPGETANGTATYVVTEADIVAGSVDNSATATGTPPDGCVDCTSPTTPPSNVEVPTQDPGPAVTLTKTVDTTGPVKVT